MRAFVQAPNRRPYRVAADEALVLVSDTWNDFSYRTLYRAYLQTPDQVRELGGVKILKQGQAELEVPLPEGELEGGRLPREYGSLGAQIDYYGEVAALGRRGEEILTGLNDVVVNAERLEALRQDEGFRRSLLRDHSDPETYYGQVREILRLGGRPPPASSFEFSYRPEEVGECVAFRFAPPPSAPMGVIPKGPSHRVVVLVGANGVGKTQLLARIARLAYAPPAERNELIEDGVLEAPAFPSIVAVSYSAFDTFDPPRLQGDDIDEVARQLEEGTGQYTYCGMRDLAAKVRNPGSETRVFSESELAAIFSDRLRRVIERERLALLAKGLQPLFREPGFRQHMIEALDQTGLGDAPDAAPDVLLKLFVGDDPAGAFRVLSSGHKIVLHMLTQLVASLNSRGLALIDEPETHLHPPLLAALMSGLRHILDKLGSYALVATHSPVVAQETLGHQVIIVESDGSAPAFRLSQIETFGENVGTLTREIFGLHTDATDFRAVLDRMVGQLGDLADIEAHLGGQLSGPALAHLMARMDRKAPDA